MNHLNNQEQSFFQDVACGPFSNPRRLLAPHESGRHYSTNQRRNLDMKLDCISYNRYILGQPHATHMHAQLR